MTLFIFLVVYYQEVRVSKRQVFISLLFIWLGLAAIPAWLWITQQTLFPYFQLDTWFADGLFALTSTGTAPYAIATVLVFFAMSYVCLCNDWRSKEPASKDRINKERISQNKAQTRHPDLNRRKSLWKQMLAAITLSLVISVSLNHSLKSYFAEPRPNVTWLSQQPNSTLDLTHFYQHNEPQRREVMAATIQQYQSQTGTLSSQPPVAVSSHLLQHWVHEVGYAFPSGHTIFATTLVLTASYYLLFSGAIGLNIGLFLWGAAMGISRMILGMHWSQDVLVSTCLAAVISSLSIGVIHTLCYSTKLGDILRENRKM